MPNRVLDKILLLTKNWSLIGTKKYPVKRLGQESLDRLQDEIGIVEVPKSANLCRGARRGGKSFDGKLGGHPALWFAHDSKLCKEENRERVFFYRPKHRLRLLDLREAGVRQDSIKQDWHLTSCTEKKDISSLAVTRSSPRCCTAN